MKFALDSIGIYDFKKTKTTVNSVYSKENKIIQHIPKKIK